MRLWSFHPEYLDARGLVALWREALLAQAVLAGRTEGYRRHPQLERFRGCAEPDLAIAEYLRAVHAESIRRGYSFDGSRIGRGGGGAFPPIAVPRGQVEYEWTLFKHKLMLRDRPACDIAARIAFPALHPLFSLVPGGVAPWERQKNLGSES